MTHWLVRKGLKHLKLQLALYSCQGLHPCLCMLALRSKVLVQGCCVILKISVSIRYRSKATTFDGKPPNDSHGHTCRGACGACLYESCQHLLCRRCSVACVGGDSALPLLPLPFSVVKGQNVLRLHEGFRSFVARMHFTAFRTASIQGGIGFVALRAGHGLSPLHPAPLQVERERV